MKKILVLAFFLFLNGGIASAQLQIEYVEELLAQEGNPDALELYVPDKREWDYWMNAARSIVYKYNWELRAGLLSVRINREDRVLYIYKNSKIGFDRYLR